jgi:inorganic triphosphatase YgiF
MRHAGARIELALDLGHVSAAGRVQAICELELELKAGAEVALYALAERWLAAHGLWLCAESKAARGARLARGEAAAPPVKARAPQFDGEAPRAASALRAVTRSCLEQMVGNASALADGSDDVDHVHQMRVGLRRMRSALREMGDFGGDIDSAWEPTLSQAFRELGAHRDRAVVLPRWAAELARCGAPPLALPASTLPGRDLVSIARDPRLQRTLLGLLCFSATGANADPAGEPDDAGDTDDARHRFAQRLQELHEHIVRDAKRFGKLDGTQQHRVRKRLKRLRYLSEFAAPLFSGKTVGRYLAAMSGAQDELGTLNDEHTAADAWRRDAERQPHAWFAVGWLAARQADGVRRSERALRQIAKAPRFWKKAVA